MDKLSKTQYSINYNDKIADKVETIDKIVNEMERQLTVVQQDIDKY